VAIAVFKLLDLRKLIPFCAKELEAIIEKNKMNLIDRMR
jgi:hypothetical protein